MRKQYIGFVAGLLLLAGCAKDELAVQTDEGVRSFTSLTATIGEMAADTRAHLENGSQANKRVVWDEEYESITVFSDTETDYKTFNLMNVDATGTARFGGNEVTADKEIYAFYAPKGVETPYWYNEDDEDVQNPYRLVTYLYPQDGATSENGFRFETPMVAKGGTDGSPLVFKQTVGLIHVSVGDISSLEYVGIQGNKGENLGGRGYIDVRDDNPVFKLYNTEPEYNDYSKWFDGIALQEGKTVEVYFVIPPQTFSKGISIRIQGRDEEGNYVSYMKTYSKKLTVGRAEVKDFKLVNMNAELEAYEKSLRENLLAIYDALDGDNWYWNYGWDEETPLHEWDRLEWDNGRLVGLDLSGANESGEGVIPEEIAQLKDLKYLNLYGSHLTSIPENTIGKMKNLERLDIHYNQLATLPDDFEELVNLWHLNLDENQFTEFPSVIFSLDNLTELSMQYNSITGEILDDFTELKKLQSLNLESNQLTGDVEDWEYIFTDLPDLRRLYLNYNQLSGTITQEIQQTDFWKNKQTGFWDILRQYNAQGDYEELELENPVTGIVLDKVDITLLVGEKTKVTWTLNPASAWCKDVILNYYGDCVSIDEKTGEITALHEGDTWITVNAADYNGASAEFHVRVAATSTVGDGEGFNGTEHDWNTNP